jgi:hypothetical protein
LTVRLAHRKSRMLRRAGLSALSPIQPTSAPDRAAARLESTRANLTYVSVSYSDTLATWVSSGRQNLNRPMSIGGCLSGLSESPEGQACLPATRREPGFGASPKAGLGDLADCRRQSSSVAATFRSPPASPARGTWRARARRYGLVRPPPVEEADVFCQRTQGRSLRSSPGRERRLRLRAIGHWA